MPLKDSRSAEGRTYLPVSLLSMMIFMMLGSTESADGLGRGTVEMDAAWLSASATASTVRLRRAILGDIIFAACNTARYGGRPLTNSDTIK